MCECNKKNNFSNNAVLNRTTNPFISSGYIFNNKFRKNCFVTSNDEENLILNYAIQFPTTHNERVVFENEQHYETFTSSLANKTENELDILEKKFGFTSYRTFQKTVFIGNPDRTISDMEFASVLNSKGIVQIGNFVFKVDMQNQKVLVLHGSDENNLLNLERGIIMPGIIEEYSTNEDVFSILEEQETGLRLGCGEKCKWLQSQNNQEKYTSREKEYRATILSDYHFYGIWCTLKVHLHHSKKNIIWNLYPVGMAIHTYGMFKKKCRTPTTFDIWNGGWSNLPFVGNSLTNTAQMVVKIYTGGRCLAEAKVDVFGGYNRVNGSFSVLQNYTLSFF